MVAEVTRGEYALVKRTWTVDSEWLFAGKDGKLGCLFQVSWRWHSIGVAVEKAECQAVGGEVRSECVQGRT